MKKRIYLVLIIIFAFVIHPAFAQEEAPAAAVPAAEELTVEAGEEEAAAAETTAEAELAIEEEPAAEAKDAEATASANATATAELNADETADEDLAEALYIPPAAPRPVITFQQFEGPEDINIIRNNRYFLESRRLAALADETFSYGDYDASAGLAKEAKHYALLSDVHVAIAIAKYRLDRAASTGASKQYPAEYGEAQMWYGKSISARDNEEWIDSIEAAYKVMELLAYMEMPDKSIPLPASYTVREWVSYRDCFWNISGYPWVYGDPHKWRILYNANKSKLPNPNNPNLIEPGMIMDIPSIKGELRQGMWETGKTYKPIE